jgi:hypothetical protein
MRLRVLVVVATLACAIVPLIGAAQDKSSKEAPNSTPPKNPPTVFRIVELGEDKSLKWSDVQTPDVKIPLSIVNDGEKPLSAVVTATPFPGAAAPAAVQLNGKPSPLTIELHVAKPAGVTRFMIARQNASPYRARSTTPTAIPISDLRSFETVKENRSPSSGPRQSVSSVNA